MTIEPTSEPANVSCALSGARGNRFINVVLLALLYSLVTGMVVGFVMYHISSTFLKLACCAGLGVILGKLLSGTGQTMHCRSSGAMSTIAAIGGLICVQAAFTTYVWSLANSFFSGPPLGLSELVMKPYLVWQFLYDISGSFVKNGQPVRPLNIWLHWQLEVGVAAIPAFVMVHRHYSKLNYCERCEEWLITDRKCLFFEAPTDVAITEALERSELEALTKIKLLSELEYPYIRLEYAACKVCNGCGVYQIFHVSNTSDAVVERELTPTFDLHAIDRPVLSGLIAARAAMEKPNGLRMLAATKSKPPVTG